MAVKFLTTKKHSKTAKAIDKIKETNKVIEVVKPSKKVATKPVANKVALIGKREYNRALKIVNLYQIQNEKS